MTIDCLELFKFSINAKRNVLPLKICPSHDDVYKFSVSSNNVGLSLTVHDNRWQSILSGVYDTCSHKQVRVYQYSRKYEHLFPLILTVQTSGILCHQSFP